MAFVNRIGNVLKQTMSKQINVESSASNAALYQAIRSMSSKLFVGGLSWGTDDTSLGQAFSQHGQVVEARVIIDRDNGRSRGFGFVTFESAEEAARAIEALDGQDLHGRRIRVNYATEKPRAPRYDGGFGGGNDSFNYGGGPGGGYQSYRDRPYDGGNYPGGNNSAGGDNYVGGGDGSYAGGNSSYGSDDVNFGDVGPRGGNSYFNRGLTNQGSFADSASYAGNPSPDYGNPQEQLSGDQDETGALDEDVEGDMLDGNYKDDDNDEPDDYANRRG